MSFDKIAESLNTTFVDPSTSAIDRTREDSQTFSEEFQNELSTFSERKDKLVKAFDKKIVTLEDKNYLMIESKTMLINGKMVLEKLQSEIKQGSSPRMYEVYSDLYGSVMAGIKQLVELNKILYDIEKRNEQEERGINGSGTTVNIIMTGKNMNEILKKAREENSMNAVDGSFKDVKE